MSDTDAARERITGAIADAIRAGELGETTTGMPAGWVMVGLYHDEDGDLRTYLMTSSGAHLHETLGLLAMGRAAWEPAAQRWIDGSE